MIPEHAEIVYMREWICENKTDWVPFVMNRSTEKHPKSGAKVELYYGCGSLEGMFLSIVCGGFSDFG